MARISRSVSAFQQRLDVMHVVDQAQQTDQLPVGNKRLDFRITVMKFRLDRPVEFQRRFELHQPGRIGSFPENF